MTELVPSYLTKINRAKKHLDDLRAAVGEYQDAHPYEAFQCAEHKKKVWRMRITSNPANSQIPIIAADLVYNLRSGLDHLAAALVPASFASHVAFPIFWPGVWEPPVPGENKERLDAHGRWNTYTRKMRPEAVAILRDLQPDQDTKYRIHHLVTINRLSNTDRHTKFPVLVSGLKDIRVRIDGGRVGSVPVANVPPEYNAGFLLDGAEIGFPSLPRLPAQVQLTGTPVVVIRIAQKQGNLPIPATFENAVHYIETEVVRPLLPYVWARS